MRNSFIDQNNFLKDHYIILKHDCIRESLSLLCKVFEVSDY